MAGFNNTLARLESGGFKRYKGVMVVGDDGLLAVNVNGNIIPASYSDPVVVAAGDAVVVDLVKGASGQSEAVVTGRLTLTPRPPTGTVATVPVGSPTVTITGSDGATYDAGFVGSYTPVVGDRVILAWNAANPTITGTIGATDAPDLPQPPVAAPPGAANTGTSTYAASDSATYVAAFAPPWDNWAGGGGHVYQGGASYGGPTYGAWFYAGSPKELAGRTITGVQFTIGSRRNVGASNAPVTVHFYAHTSPNRPGGDVTREVGPYDVTIPAGAGQITLDLTAAGFASVIQAGGGIAIAGENYAGFNGRNTQPTSGKLTLDWKRS